MATTTQVSGHPVRVEIDYPEELSRLSTAFRLFLLIPHAIALFVYGIGAWFASIGAFFTILFTGGLSPGLFDFILGFDRYTLRYGAYSMLLTDRFPPFGGGEDLGYPARLSFQPPDSLSRGLISVKWLLVIPHWIVLLFYAVAVVVVLFIAWFAILFSGRYPRSFFDFVVGYQRWLTRLTAYSGTLGYYNAYVGGLLTDEYPPFSNE